MVYPSHTVGLFIATLESCIALSHLDVALGFVVLCVQMACPRLPRSMLLLRSMLLPQSMLLPRSMVPPMAVKVR